MPDYESIMIIKLACSYCGKAMTWSTACDLGKVCLERQDLPVSDAGTYSQNCVDNVGGGAGDCGDCNVGLSLGPEAGIDVDDMQPRVRILAGLRQVILVSHAFSCFSQGAPNAVSRHSVHLHADSSS